MKTRAETGQMCPRAKDGWPPPAAGRQSRGGPFLAPCRRLDFGLQPSCCFKPPCYGSLIRWPWEADAGHQAGPGERKLLFRDCPICSHIYLWPGARTCSRSASKSLRGPPARADPTLVTALTESTSSPPLPKLPQPPGLLSDSQHTEHIPASGPLHRSSLFLKHFPKAPPPRLVPSPLPPTPTWPISAGSLRFGPEIASHPQCHL